MTEFKPVVQGYGSHMNVDARQRDLDTGQLQASGLPDPSCHPISSFIREPSTPQDRRSRSRRPAAHSRGSPGPMVDWRDSLQSQPAAYNRPPGTARRARSHSRSHPDRIAYPEDFEAPAVPVSPPRPQAKQWSIPSTVPPGYPDGTVWVRSSSGWPELVMPENPPAQNKVKSSIVRSPAQQNELRPSQHDHVECHSRLETPAFQRESTRLSRTKSANTQDAPRRSRSHSRSRVDQVAPHSDTSAPPVPLIPSPSTRQQKPFPIPTVIPPSYPEDTRWTVGLSGRPRLEASGSSVLFSSSLI
ncbi:hypothetical protein DL96DRAFT_1716816 [Flagelloscypha sp. PMI_526]|nr:hypothetical protein DL96DRAFT_1716816 [Flagelloscypha sp. PMI_526]